jgi:inorganic pyrophosphatase
MIDVKPIALFRMEDDKGLDDKVLAVPLHDPGWNALESVEVKGWFSRQDAVDEIAASRARFRDSAAH